MNMIIRKRYVLLLCMLIGLVGFADAITNGGFETGDFTGWVADGTAIIVSSNQHTGTYSASTSTSITSPGSISATVDFTNAETLFVYGNGGGNGYVKIDSTNLQTGIDDAGWVLHTYDVSSYTGLHTLTLGSNNVAWLVDDITIETQSEPSASVEVIVGGSIPEPEPQDSYLSISSNAPEVSFPSFHVGDNFAMDQGTLTVNSLNTGWTVSVAASPGIYGRMNDGDTRLTYPLFQYDADGVWRWVSSMPGLHWSMSGASSPVPDVDTLSMSYKQTIDPADPPGDYSTTLTYTITAV